jgi:adenine phosphoribosyltransferase
VLAVSLSPGTPLAGAMVTRARFVDLPDLGGVDALRADWIEVTSLAAFERH